MNLITWCETGRNDLPQKTNLVVSEFRDSGNPLHLFKVLAGKRRSAPMTDIFVNHPLALVRKYNCGRCMRIEAKKLGCQRARGAHSRLMSIREGRNRLVLNIYCAMGPD